MTSDVMPLHGMQLNLFKGVGYPPRPDSFSEKVLDMTIDALMPSIRNWMTSDDDRRFYVSDKDESDIRQELRQAIEFKYDGYLIAKELDDYNGWDSDEQLVRILDGVAALRYTAKNSLVKEWVLQNGVMPEYSVGQRVTFKCNGEVKSGIVKLVDMVYAQYRVACEDRTFLIDYEQIVKEG